MSDPKVIILTGASRGIGLATAHFLLKGLNKLVVVARSAGPLNKLKEQYPGQVECLAADLADFSVGPKAVSLALKAFGGLDSLIINHGTLSPVNRVADSTPEEWRAIFDVNFFSAIAFITPAIPSLRESHGRIVLISSGAATNTYSTWGAYGSSKAALNHLAQTLSTEEPDITTVSMRPGVVDTDMQLEIREKHKHTMDATDTTRFMGLYADGKLLRPEQPGHVMARLAVGATKELSGKFLTWNDKSLDAFQDS